jgi:hypothetical protein
MAKHKHYDVIVAWAEGKEIQYRPFPTWEWINVNNFEPSWFLSYEYRIKPEPKPDKVLYLGLDLTNKKVDYSSFWTDLPVIYGWPVKLKVIFDEETGKLKSAEVLNV